MQREGTTPKSLVVAGGFTAEAPFTCAQAFFEHGDGKQVEEDRTKEAGALGSQVVYRSPTSVLLAAPALSQSRLPLTLFGNDGLLEPLDFVKLPGSHLVNQLLNRRNVRLANPYQLHARKSSPAG